MPPMEDWFTPCDKPHLAHVYSRLGLTTNPNRVRGEEEAEVWPTAVSQPAGEAAVCAGTASRSREK